MTPISEPLAIVILTEASSSVGFGHLNRCLVLGEALRAAGNRVSLFAWGDDSVAKVLPSDSWARLVDHPLVPAVEADLCVVDLFTRDETFLFEVRGRFERIALIDDGGAPFPAVVSAVINPNVHANPGLYPHGVKVFAGHRYALLRTEFTRPPSPGRGDRVLLCVGGSDPTGQMERLLSIVSEATGSCIDAVYGPGFRQDDVVERWNRHPRIVTHRAVREMRGLMEQASYAVVSAGSILYELVRLGVPTACIALSEEQASVGSTLAGLGAVSYLGHYEALSDSELKTRLIEFDADHAFRERLGATASRIIDGGGAQRLAHDLTDWLAGRVDPLAAHYSRADVEAEYEASARLESEHLQVRWGSADAMSNRHELVMRELPLGSGGLWLDVGSGTGALQERVCSRFPRVRAVGVELSAELFAIAVGRNLRNVRFSRVDFMDFGETGFEFLTCIGVLSKTNFGLEDFIHHAARTLERGGWLMIDFKNLDGFGGQESGEFPDARHRWFPSSLIAEIVTRDSLFEMTKLSGYVPAEDRTVDLTHSRTAFLIARRTGVEPPSGSRQ